TGFFGSELLRALHLTGAVNSKELVSFFGKTNTDDWIKDIKFSNKLKYLNIPEFKIEIEETIEQLLEYKKQNSINFPTLNKFYYYFVLEEIFRKVFGPIIFAQSNYIKVRTPFLDLKFMKVLFKSKIAGMNNDFFTHNPLKRFQGQLLYAKIISLTYPELGKHKTQKGYRPNDLLTLTGRLNIILPYLQKKIRRKVRRSNLDNLAILSSMQYNWDELQDNINSTGYYNFNILNLNKSNIMNVTENERDIVSYALSTTKLLEKIGRASCRESVDLGGRGIMTKKKEDKIR